MKQLLLLSLTLLLWSCQSTENQAEQTTQQAQEANSEGTYDAALAEKLGADEYGMGRYVMAFLKAGPNRPQDSLKAAQLQQAHLQNIVELAEEGKLIVAGPFMDNGPIRGIYIFDVETIEEARALTETDPAIQAGSLIMELHPWYGSAALRQTNSIHSRISREGITD